MRVKLNTDRYPGDLGVPRDHSAFLNSNITRWCALCGTNKPQLGGTIKWVMGGRHWCCAKHKKASQ